MTLNEKFMIEVAKIKEAEVFCGLLRIFKVPMVTPDWKPGEVENTRDFADVFADLMEAYAKSDRKRKREALKILKDANREQAGDYHAD